ncbi:hypothetical protein BHE74_00030522 [Ensete ventricosum]|nr:hypothetical protein BHE74_00030522 [Ensete ventricosum]
MTNQGFRFELFRPVQAVCTGPTRYWFVDRSLPGGIVETGVSQRRDEATPPLPTRDEAMRDEATPPLPMQERGATLSPRAGQGAISSPLVGRGAATSSRTGRGVILPQGEAMLFLFF